MIVSSISVLTLSLDFMAILLACAVIAGTALSLYLLLLAVASLRGPVAAPVAADEKGSPATRFAVLIPAHEEELVIARLLESVNAVHYPQDLYEVHVIADHCSDRTAAIARSYGATVHERSDPAPRGKSQSLRWLVQRLIVCQCASSVDAFVVLDADSIISPNFLRAMDLHMRAGHPLLQGLVQIEDPGTDWIGQLRSLAYEFISHLRPLGRNALGLSVGFRGNGLCIARDIAERFPWDADALTEDYELHGRLLAAGLRVAFAPGAVVLTQLPQSLAVARTQSDRWERGRLDAMKRHVPNLLAEGLRRRSWALIDGAIELLVPPFSIFMAMTLVLLGLSILSGITPLIVVAAAGVVAQSLYTFRGLALTSARYPHIYRALLFVPAFVAWRVAQYVGVLARRRPVQWTRTLRTPATAASTNRICIVRHYYYPEDPRSRREAEALADAGHHVDILTLRHAGEPAHEVINGVHVTRLPVKHYRGSLFHYAYEYGAFFVLSLLVLGARMVRKPYDVVQVNSLPDFLVFATLPCKYAGTPVVLDMHECTPELYCTKYGVSHDHPVVRILAWIEQRSLAFANQLITCTPQQRDVFASRGTPAEKIEVVLNAANSAVFRPRTPEPVMWQPGEPWELVAHGLVAERYGLDTMVRAVALLKKEIPGIVLHVYGKGPYLQEMKALACELGLANHVVAHGFVSEEELLDGIGRAHVGVVGAKRDKFRELTHTQKMYEYVAMRKPVVIAETSAVRTHFDDSCFQFFASDDPADLARALRDLYYNPARAMAMIESASQRYRSYAWETQRYVYCETVIDLIPQQARGRIAPQEQPATLEQLAPQLHAAPVNYSDLPAVPVEAIPVLSHLELSEIALPIDDESLYLSETAVPAEDGVYQ